MCFEIYNQIKTINSAHKPRSGVSSETTLLVFNIRGLGQKELWFDKESNNEWKSIMFQGVIIMLPDPCGLLHGDI